MSRINEDLRVLEVFSLSNRASKRMDLQIHDISKAHLYIGEKKGEYIEKHKAEYMKEKGIDKLNAHDKGQIAQLHSWADYHKFKSCNMGFAHYVRNVYGVKNIVDFRPEFGRAFLSELADLGYSKNTVNGYITQMEKLGAFTGVNYHSAIKGYRRTEEYKSLEEKDTTTRAYENPQKIIEALSNIGAREITVDKAQFSASLSLNYGLRVSDACHFKLLANNQILYNSKNGMKTTKTLTPQDYVRAESLSVNGKYNMSVNTLKDCWAKACRVAGVEPGGLHGLRHNFGQNLYNDLTVNKGLQHRAACLIVSHEMNHTRPGITETYLR